MAAVKGSRAYSSPRREEAAGATRCAILDAAHRLFLSQGYAATTIDAIAEASAVSRPTVFSVGSKAELLKRVRDIAIAGDDEPVAVPGREPVAQMRRAPDPETTLRLHARNVVAISSRYADVEDVLRQARLAGATIVIDDVLSKGPLKPEIDRRRAIGILWLLMAPDHLRRMRERGWDDSAFEEWLADTVVAQLLQ